MKIETKFDLGQKVYRIGTTSERTKATCAKCAGTGACRVTFADLTAGTLRCDHCHGTGWVYVEPVAGWAVRGTDVIGQVRVQETRSDGLPGYEDWQSGQHNLGPRPYSYEEQYMLVGTGIGSGTIWPVAKLFASNEEALAECDRLNALPVCPACGSIEPDAACDVCEDGIPVAVAS